MKPTFLLFHVECVNESQNAVCHLILIPVVGGVKQVPQEFFFNPEAPFLSVMSGITKQQVNSFPTFSELWPSIQVIFNDFDFAMCTAEGYGARALCATLRRLGVRMPSMPYCNAKAVCRRTMDEVSYCLDYLSYAKFNDTVAFDDPVAIAIRWCDLVIMGLAESSDHSLEQFTANHKIKVGSLSSDDFVPSLCLRDYSKRKDHAFDPSVIDVVADSSNPLYGMNVVFTGKLESLKRDEARTLVVKVGGFAPERLTTETDYLVVGVQDLRVVGEKGLSGKMKMAAKFKDKGYPIEVIDEKEFIEMIGKENIPQRSSEPYLTLMADGRYGYVFKN